MSSDYALLGRGSRRGAPVGAASRYPLPLLTSAATAVAVAAAIVQYTMPATIGDFQRVPGGGLPHGQWWRLVTPLLVQTLGWYQVLANLVTLVLVGVVAERLLGSAWWMVSFVAGTAAGQAAAYAWHEPGGGDSIAICGLAGAAVVALLLGPRPNRPAVYGVVCYIAALAGWGFRGPAAAVLAGLVAVAGLFAIGWFSGGGAARLALIVAVGCAFVMALAQNLHGVSLLGGMLVVAVPAVARRILRPQVL